MIDLAAMYLHNLAKRGFTNGYVAPVEIARAPKLIDQTYGDGNGSLDIHDLDDLASNVVEEISDKIGDLVDFVTSIF